MKLRAATLGATVALGLFASSLTAEAQRTGTVHRIGMLETRSADLNAANVDAFRRGLSELGYKEEQNLKIEYRSSDGRDDRFPALASELVGLKVDLILTRGTPAALAAKSAAGTIALHGACAGTLQRAVQRLSRFCNSPVCAYRNGRVVAA